MKKNSLLLSLFIILASLNGCSKCGENEANNKMLALNRVQGRMFAKGGEALTAFAISLQTETASISELIAQQKYGDACAKLDEIEKKYKFDLTKEQEGMITYEQMKEDGGKGNGKCSIADAATKQMEVHRMLQAEVDAGRKNPDIFNTFNEDTKGYAEMLTTNPSKACDLFDRLIGKYGLKK